LTVKTNAFFLGIKVKQGKSGVIWLFIKIPSRITITDGELLTGLFIEMVVDGFI